MKRAIRYGGEYEIGNFVTAIRAFCALMVVLTYLIVTTTPANAQLPSAGIISTARATNWTTVGVTGGVPSATWTQCGPSIAAYTGTAATINNALAHTSTGYTACGANTYIQLTGTPVNITSGTGVRVGLNSEELRGDPTTGTHIVESSGVYDSCSGGYHAGICIGLGSGEYWVTNPTVAWTAGFSQGTAVITLASVAGIVPNQSLVMLSQCSDGNTDSGSGCSQTAETDNGQFFNCDIVYNTSAKGCAVNGPDGGNQQLNRPQMEIFQVSAVNTGTNQVTLIGSLRNPNWNASYSPAATVITNPVQYSGVRNIVLDMTAANGPNGIVFYDTANCWAVQNETIKTGYSGIWVISSAHDSIQQNYMYGTVNAPGGDSTSFATSATDSLLVESNIGQFQQTFYIGEGSDTGTVFAYNYDPNNYDNQNGLYEAIFPHAGDHYELFEGNIFNAYNGENFHGPKIMNTLFRNQWWGWNSGANDPSPSYKNSGTNAVDMVAYSRYHNIVGNVLGTPSYHNAYQTGSATSIYLTLGAGNTSSFPATIPTDTVVSTTTMRWANWDVASNAVRLCGNSGDTGWSTTCASTSEVPTAGPSYPNAVPTLGDTGIGQSPMPPSFYLTSKPAWFGSIPFPAIGPDVTGGNVGQCVGQMNPAVPGTYAGMPATASGQCTGNTFNISAYAGHVNTNPAMNCFLNVMGGPPDGSNSSALTFTPATITSCYPTSSGPVTPTVPSSILPLTFNIVVPVVIPPIKVTAPAMPTTISQGTQYSFAIGATGCGTAGTSACACSMPAIKGWTVSFTKTATGCTMAVLIAPGSYTTSQTVTANVTVQ